MANRHTIILLQPSRDKTSRTFLDYPTVTRAMDGVCKDFERKLRSLNPHMPTITYEITDLYGYIDDMVDISALVYDPKLNAYIPCNREWIKSTAYDHLKNEGTGGRR